MSQNAVMLLVSKLCRMFATGPDVLYSGVCHERIGLRMNRCRSIPPINPQAIEYTVEMI